MGWLQSKRQVMTSVGEAGEELEPSHAAGGDVKCGSHSGKRSGIPQKKLKRELSHDPEIFFYVHPQEK